MEKDYEKIKQSLGELIREKRQKQDYTRVQLAEMTEVSRNEILHIEQGCVMPSLETIDRICVALKIKFSEIAKIVEDEKFIIKKDLKREKLFQEKENKNSAAKNVGGESKESNKSKEQEKSRNAESKPLRKRARKPGKS